MPRSSGGERYEGKRAEILYQLVLEHRNVIDGDTKNLSYSSATAKSAELNVVEDLTLSLIHPICRFRCHIRVVAHTGG